jgi:cell division protein FtsZ
LIAVPGLINLDFADVKTIMEETGTALMGIGIGSGDNRTIEAASAAISSPLLETSIEGARGVLLNITGGANLGLFEVNEAADIVAEAADPEANIIFGAVIDENMKDEVRVTVIATGFDTLPVPKSRLHEEISRRFAEGDLDIPAFLRKNPENPLKGLGIFFQARPSL